MADESTTVDILSLEDYRRTLDTRLTEANNLLKYIRESVPKAPQLGGFHDAGTTASQHSARHAAHVTKVQRLITAIEAAQTATDTIIRNYTSTEARNNANSKDIGSVLGGVSKALEEGTDG